MYCTSFNNNLSSDRNREQIQSCFNDMYNYCPSTYVSEQLYGINYSLQFCPYTG